MNDLMLAGRKSFYRIYVEISLQHDSHDFGTFCGFWQNVPCTKSNNNMEPSKKYRLRISTSIVDSRSLTYIGIFLFICGGNFL